MGAKDHFSWELPNGWTSRCKEIRLILVLQYLAASFGVFIACLISHQNFS